MSSHKPECDAKWVYDQDHCICKWIELAEQRIIKLLEAEGCHCTPDPKAGKCYPHKLIALIKGEK